MNNYSPYWDELYAQKPNLNRKIGFVDGTDPRVLKALQELSGLNLFTPLVFGNENAINECLEKHQIRVPQLNIFDSDVKGKSSSSWQLHIQEFFSRKKIEESEQRLLLKTGLYPAMALLKEGNLDAVIAGAGQPTADVVKAALGIVGPVKGKKLVSGHFYIESVERKSLDNTPFLFSDSAVMPEPSSKALSIIGYEAAQAYKFMFNRDPKVAFLTFSTRQSADHPVVQKVIEAVNYFKALNSGFSVDGDLQADAALDGSVAKIKGAGDSSVAGKANVIIFPNLESGNIGYKLIQRFSTVRIAGPLLWGLKHPVSDLSRGCTVQEIKDTVLTVFKWIEASK